MLPLFTRLVGLRLRSATDAEAGDVTARRRPSRLALEAVFTSASPLPEGGNQLLSHLEGETEAAGALLGSTRAASADPRGPEDATQPYPPLPQHHQEEEDQLHSGPPSAQVQLPMPPPHQLELEPSSLAPRPGSPRQGSPRQPSPRQLRPSFEPFSDMSRRDEGHSAFTDQQSSYRGVALDSPTPNAALRKLSDATVVAKQISSDAAVCQGAELNYVLLSFWFDFPLFLPQFDVLRVDQNTRLTPSQLQALYGHYSEQLKALFGKFASKRVQGALVLTENGCVR